MIFHNFVKKISSKWSVKTFVSIVIFLVKMAPKNKKTKESIIEFYKLHGTKGHWYTYKQWQGCCFFGIKQKQKEINHDIVIRMFENLKGRIHLAKENGLSSLIKF